MRSALQAEGRRFESVNAHKMEASFDASIFFCKKLRFSILI